MGLMPNGCGTTCKIICPSSNMVMGTAIIVNSLVVVKLFLDLFEQQIKNQAKPP
jgi:hypothetical protein